MTMQEQTGGISAAEKALFSEWRKKHEEEGYTDFVADGVVNEDAYCQSEKKLLFVLKEANSPGKGGGGWDLSKDYIRRGCVTDNGEIVTQTWTNITRWVAGIRRFPEVVPWEEIYPIGMDVESRCQVLVSIAAMNQKKVPGGSVADNKVVGQFAARDHALLSRQISLYSPDLIICCGDHLENNLHHHLWRAKPRPKTSQGVEFFEYESGRYVVDYHHPAAIKNHQKMYEDLMAAVREILAIPVA